MRTQIIDYQKDTLLADYDSIVTLPKDVLITSEDEMSYTIVCTEFELSGTLVYYVVESS